MKYSLETRLATRSIIKIDFLSCLLQKPVPSSPQSFPKISAKHSNPKSQLKDRDTLRFRAQLVASFYVVHRQWVIPSGRSKRVVPPTLPPNGGASGQRLAEEIAEVFRFRKDNVASYVNQPGMRV